MAGINNEKLNITLHIYDEDIQVTIPRKDEELYRNAAKLITSTISSYAEVYRGRKGEKIIHYMALIDIALRYAREAKRNDMTPVNELLGKLTSEIEKALDDRE